jgi:hypothetical protein
MPRNLGNFIGFTSTSSYNYFKKAVWHVVDQYYFKDRDNWLQRNISATGGSESTPGDGYKYHVFNSPGTFAIDALGEESNAVEVMLQGGGGGGRPGQGGGGSNAPGGAGGGGGATGVWEYPVSILTAGNYPVSVGAGGPINGSGSASSFTNLDTTFISAGGGAAGPSGPATNSAPWPGVPQPVNLAATGGPGYPGSFGGTGGTPAGGTPQPGLLWWKPYMAPGGAAGSSGHTSPGGAGSTYGGGGGGGGGSFDGGPASPGGPGAAGRVVIRYPFA